MNTTEHMARRLIGLGFVLFFCGLITGYLVPLLASPRMGLSGHLEGLMNGTFLVAVGAVWSRIALPRKPQLIAYWSLIFGTFVNWASVTYAAYLGVVNLNPVLGFQDVSLQKVIVAVGLHAIGVAMVVACALLIWGFFRKPPAFAV